MKGMKNMIRCGLVSVSFRSLSPAQIIRCASESGLDGIEWGGDVHVPAGDLAAAQSVAAMTAKAGLSVCAYGSYYRAGTYGERYLAEFQKVLDTAVRLGAPVIRIWAGVTGSAETPPAERSRITAECRTIAALAKEKKITVTFECHRNTLTDDFHSALRLMKETAQDNLRMYWQPNETQDFAYNLQALQALLPYVEQVHVFHWPDTERREPLRNGRAEWAQYLSVLAADGRPRRCSLEFMPDNDPASLPGEAQTLRELLESIENI